MIGILIFIYIFWIIFDTTRSTFSIKMNASNYKWLESIKSNTGTSGVILEDGTHIRFGYNEHKYYQPRLIEMGLDDSVYDSTQVIRISSNCYNGNVYEDIYYYEKGDVKRFTQAQLNTIFKLRFEVKSDFLYKNSLNSLFNIIDQDEEYGKKWAGLKFLKYYYPEYKYPNIDKGDKYNFLRTSLKHQYAGIIDSGNTRSEIQLAIDALPDTIKDSNEFHVFSQEYIEGTAHTCQFFNEEYSGVDKFKDLVLDLASNTNKDIQLELVDNTIVESKFFERQSIADYDPYRKADYEGTVFHSGNATGTIGHDIMIVSNDSIHPSLLVDKKALLVEGSPKFSHILCLARHLDIPAVYNVGTMTYGEHVEINGNKIYKL